MLKHVAELNMYKNTVLVKKTCPPMGKLQNKYVYKEISIVLLINMNLQGINSLCLNLNSLHTLQRYIDITIITDSFNSIISSRSVCKILTKRAKDSW